MLRQAIRRLPSKFYGRCGKYCLKLRSIRKPTLIDLKTWLNERIQTSTGPYLLQTRDNISKGIEGKMKNVRHTCIQQRLKENQTTLQRTNVLSVKETIDLQVPLIFNHGTIKKI